MDASELEPAALMQVSRDWAKASASRDLELIVSFWADDAVVLAPDRPALVGKRAIREYVRESLAIPGFSITWEPERGAIAIGGDLGYLVERNRLTFVNADGTRQTQHGKAVTVWRRNPAGEWKCVVDVWNGGPSDQVRTGDP